MTSYMRSAEILALAAPETLYRNKARLMAEEIHRTRGNVRLKLGHLCTMLNTKLTLIEQPFRSLYAVTPKLYQQIVRLDWACNLLLYESMVKIDSVAAACGYDKTPDFISFFKQNTGITPKQFCSVCKTLTMDDWVMSRHHLHFTFNTSVYHDDKVHAFKVFQSAQDITIIDPAGYLIVRRNISDNYPTWIMLIYPECGRIIKDTGVSV